MRIFLALLFVATVLWAARRIWNVLYTNDSTTLKAKQKELESEKTQYKKELEKQEKYISKEKAKL